MSIYHQEQTYVNTASNGTAGIDFSLHVGFTRDFTVLVSLDQVIRADGLATSARPAGVASGGALETVLGLVGLATVW